MGLLITYGLTRGILRLFSLCFKLAAITLAAIFVFVNFPNIEDVLNRDRDYICEANIYYTTYGNIPVCSLEPLSNKQKVELNNQLKKSLQYYPKFIVGKGHKWLGYKIPLTIFVVNNAFLNDPKYLAKNSKVKNRVGAYVKGEGDVFITPDFMRYHGDLPHEIAHYANDHLKIQRKADESLARQFERFLE